MNYFYIPPKIAFTIANERNAFFQVHGRYPTALDPIFCDPRFDIYPQPMTPDQLERLLTELSRRTGMPPQHIYAFHCAARVHPSRQMERFQQAINEYLQLTAPSLIQ